MGNYYYTKKPSSISLDIRLCLINMNSWGIKEIQLYFGTSQNKAIQIRNDVRKKKGAAPYEKNKVLVKHVLEIFHTTPEERIELLKQSSQVNIQENKTNSEEKKVQNV